VQAATATAVRTLLVIVMTKLLSSLMSTGKPGFDDRRGEASESSERLLNVS